MDLVTQVVLGAVVGQFGYQRTLGRKAIGYGALAGLLPDLDIVVKLSSNPYAEILYHRGLTHSFFFAVCVGYLAGYILYKSYGRTYPLRSWIGLMIAGLVTHPLLDFFTIYGTQLLAPFSDHRFALSAIPIIDPLYTVPLIISIIVGLVYHHRLTFSQVFSGIILFWTTLYLFIGLAMNEHVDRHVREIFAKEHIEPKQLNVYTTMLQLPLRRIVAHVDHEIWVGCASALHLGEKIHFEKIKKAPTSLTKEFIKTEDYKIFKWFSRDDLFISSTQNNDGTYTLIAHDLRYGFMHDETTFGLWGLKVIVNFDGKLLSPIEKAGINRTKLIKRLRNAPFIWYAAFDGPLSASEQKESDNMTQNVTVLETSPKTLPSEFVYVHQIHPDIRVSPRYQMTDNFIGRRFVHYFDDVLLISREAAKALYKVQERVAKDGFDLVIYDAYRPQTTVNSFTNWANDLGDSAEQGNYYPRVNKEDVFDLGYIARRSGHTRGSTVDLTLIEKAKSLKPTEKLKRTLTDGFSFDYLDDGTVDTFTHFDLFDDASHHDTALIPEEYKKWRNYLRDVMKENGFRPYSKEWWHYTLDNEPYPDTYFDFPVKNYDK